MNGGEFSTHEDHVKDQIRELFKLVKMEHREQVLDRLRRMSNDQKLSFLRGWTKNAVPKGG